MPDAVRVGRRAFSQGPKKPPVFVDDVAIVDDPVLFMHGVGAVQRLWARQEHLRDTTRFLSHRANEAASRDSARWTIGCTWSRENWMKNAS